MIIPFSSDKLVQAAAVALKELPQPQLDRMSLLKLLYLADHKALAETARPITGDTPVAMKQGPVLTNTYNCIRRSPPCHAWDRVFQAVGKFDVKLVGDPGDGLLSDYEIEVLQDTVRVHGRLTGPQLSKITHDLPEWIKNAPEGNTSRPISDRDLLEAVNLGDEADSIMREAGKRRKTQSLFAAP